MGKENLKNTAVTIKSYRYCRILIAVFFFAFALRPLPYFQAQKKPAFCRRLPSPRYIWTFPLCTPFPILYQSQASLLYKEDMFIPDVSCFAKAKGAVDVFGALTSGKVPLGFCRPQALEEVGPAIMIVSPFFKKTFDLVESAVL